MPDLKTNADESVWAGLLKGLTEVSESAFDLDSRMAVARQCVEDQAVSIGTVAREASQAARTLESLSQEAVGMAETARRTAETSSRGSDDLEQLLTRLISLETQQKDTASFLRGLGTASETLRAILEDIEDISAGLGVLAINAAIESARAGTAGQGFAVIAKEVQKVSGRTIEAAGRAAGLVKDLESRTSGIEKGLAAAIEAAALGIQAGKTVAEELSETARCNLALESGIVSLRDELEVQTEFARSMEAEAARLEESKDSLGTSAGESAQVAESLKKSVEGILLHTGSIRVGWHRACVQAMAGLAARGTSRNSDWETFLNREVQGSPVFCLLYVMAPSGRQLTDNAVAPRWRAKISGGGKGADRSARPYFLGAEPAPEAFLSPVYISTASQGLCLTVSTRLASGEVLAADVALTDLVRMEGPGS